jgi:hypothetical protein
MPLPVALVFHFNQHTNDYAHVASRACYRGLLNVLRAHPALKFNLHLSGTLLRALNWWDPATLDLVRAGLADGQFELLGSTYAQNVPYACDDWDNAQQIGLHRQVLEDLFGVRPVTFWNSERCWRQSLVPVIAEGGFTTTLVEDHILRAGGLVDPVPVATAHGAHSLTAICDDNVLRERFNYAAWFGRRAQLLKYLKGIAARPDSGRFLVAYAEDAEAMGLWNWEKGYLPHAAWANLDALLREFEESDAFRLVHLASARPAHTLPALPDRAAQWMNDALNDPQKPYHEDGYSDWFDFIQRSPKTAYFGRLYGVIRSRLQALGSAREDPGFPAPAQNAASVFYRQAIETFCHHQYEFGCIGVGGRHYWGWENARTAFLFARLAEVAEDPHPRWWIEDINGDGADEQMLCDGWTLAVFTAHGGRLIYWFDLAEGRQLHGNQLAIPRAAYRSGETKQPVLTPAPRLWLPDTFEADLKPWRALRAKEKAPTRMGARVPKWLWERAAPELTVYRRRMRLPGERLPPRAHVGAFSDAVTLDHGDPAPPDALLDYRVEPKGTFCYLHYLASHFVIEKRVRQTADGLAAYYTLDNQDKSPHHVRLTVSHELCPDYAAVLSGGRPALGFFESEGRCPGVINHKTKTGLALRPSRGWTRLEQGVNLLALELAQTFEWDVPPRAREALALELNTVKEAG